MRWRTICTSACLIKRIADYGIWFDEFRRRFSDVRHQRYAVGGRDAGVADCVYDYYAGADAFHPFGTADRVRADKQAGQTA
ncbi:hypothetical protein BN1095_7380001 [Clostridioides difficile]|uniref:Uncharacterized protein n=1 Tax=Clostridioides difficile TaxID=1496 RepID=A0A069B1K5_CLODI|nr:hypothetical protein BN1095_7380001 [Clostridioides difficile]